MYQVANIKGERHSGFGISDCRIDISNAFDFLLNFARLENWDCCLGSGGHSQAARNPGFGSPCLSLFDLPAALCSGPQTSCSREVERLRIHAFTPLHFALSALSALGSERFRVRLQAQGALDSTKESAKVPSRLRAAVLSLRRNANRCANAEQQANASGHCGA